MYSHVFMGGVLKVNACIEDNFGYQFLAYCSPFVWHRISPRLRSLLSRLEWTINELLGTHLSLPLTSQALGLQGHTTTPGFVHTLSGSNSGNHVCKASALPPETSHQRLQNFCRTCYRGFLGNTSENQPKEKKRKPSAFFFAYGHSHNKLKNLVEKINPVTKFKFAFLLTWVWCNRLSLKIQTP